MESYFNTYNKLKIVITRDWIATKNMVGYPIKPVTRTGIETIITKEKCIISTELNQLLFENGEIYKITGEVQSIKIIN